MSVERFRFIPEEQRKVMHDRLARLSAEAQRQTRADRGPTINWAQEMFELARVGILDDLLLVDVRGRALVSCDRSHPQVAGEAYRDFVAALENQHRPIAADKP